MGRCLGILGIGIDAAVASAEEVGNAVKQQENKSPTVDAKKLRLHLEDIAIAPDIDSLRLANVQAYKFAEGDQDALSAILKANNARKKELTENE